MILAETRESLREAIHRGAGPVVLVPTMGALHEGHARLLDVGRDRGGQLVASIFVNPLQFAPGEDLARYPRTFDADLEVCAAHGVAVVFAPGAEVVYPTGPPRIRIDPGPMGEILEGASRPGHFAGVLTVVAKLFGLVQPDVAVFGRKDFQQGALIQQMVRDLCLPIDVVVADTMRASDGLALSSRNGYLSGGERALALTLSRALAAGRDAGAAGPDGVLAAAWGVFATEPGVEVDYVCLRGADLGDPPSRGQAWLLIAAKVGSTRLIDNTAVDLREET